MNVGGELDPLLAGSKAESLHGVRKAVSQAEINRIDMHLPRSNLGVVEDIVQDR